jgi:hypothetical protein
VVHNLLITCGFVAHKTAVAPADIKWMTLVPFLYTAGGLFRPLFSATC